MRKNYPFIVTSCLVLSASQALAQAGGDGAEQYLNLYSTYQKAESLEKRGDSAAAFKLYQEVAKALSQFSAQYPSWSPQVVKYRSQLTGQALQRLQNTAPAPRQTAPQTAPQRPAPSSTQEATPLIPQGPERGGTPLAPTDPFAEIQRKLNQLQNDLQFALEEAQRLRKEKSDLLRNLEETANSASKALEENIKARNKAEALARILEQRSDVAERALLQAREDKTKTASDLAVVEKERDELRQQRKELQADRDAAEEVRTRLEARLVQTQGREATAVGERSAAGQQVAQAQKQVEAMKEELANAAKAQASLQTKLEKITGERDTAKAAQKQLESSKEELANAAKTQSGLQAKLEKVTGERDAAKTVVATATKERDEAKTAVDQAAKEREAAQKEAAKVAKERDAAKAEVAKVAQERDDSLAVSARLKVARGQMEKLEAENKDSAAKLAKVQQQLEQQRQDGSQSTQGMKALRDEVEGIRTKLVDSQKRAETAEKSVADLEGKLNASIQQINLAKADATQAKTDAVQAKADATQAKTETTQAKTETTQAKADAAQALADREKDKEERDLLQGILNRSLAEQSRREKARKDLVAEVSRLKVSSDALMKQIGLLGEPVLQLNEKEQALFKQPLVEISAEGISISAMKTTSKVGTAAAVPAAVPEAKGAQKPQDTTPKAETAGLKTAKLGPLSDEVRGKISEAKDRFDKGDFVNAEKLYKEVLDDAPGNAFVLSNLGVAQFRGKRYPEAEESLKKALELAPEDAFSRSTLGIVFYTQGKLDKAVDELTQSVSINPNNAVAHNYLGIAASRKGWQENARKELETAAELDPTYADAYFNLAVVCASQKPPDKDAARNAYQKATALGAAPDTRLEELIR